MKILNKKEFLALPSGFLYRYFYPQKEEKKDGYTVRSPPQMSDSLYIKLESIGESSWYFQCLDDIDLPEYDNSNDVHNEICNILNNAFKNGAEFNPDFDICERDSLYDDDEFFVIYSKDDVKLLIKTLEKLCLNNEEHL
jgi:hypothetical protein